MDFRRDGVHGLDEERVAEDHALAKALRDVPVPEGLERRLLVSVAMPSRPDVQRAEYPPTTWSRRAWLSTAAGLAGLAVTGRYLYVHRPLRRAEVIVGVEQALNSEDWVIPWRAPDSAPSDLLPPRELKRPRGWQYVSTPWAKETAAFDLTLPGGPPSVLFVARVQRGLSGFPTRLKTPPSGSTEWKRVAIWRSSQVLYVLASQGSKSDFQSLLVNAGTVPLA